MIAWTLAILAIRRPASADDVPTGHALFRTFGAAEGLGNLVIIGITQDAEGSLWVGTDDGIYRYNGDRFAHLSKEHGLLSSNILAVGLGLEGEVCAASATGLVCWDGARFVRAAGVPEVPIHTFASHAGRLWLGTANGLYTGDPRSGFVRAPGWPSSPMAAVKALWADGAGLVVGNGGAVVTGAGDGEWRTLELGLAGDRIDGVLRDRSGTLWIRSALHMWRVLAGATRAEDVSAGLPTGYDTVAVASGMALGPLGNLWVATDTGLAHRVDDRWRIIDRNTGYNGPGARTVFFDREGTLWAGAVGLHQWRGRGMTERHDVTTGLPGDVAWSFQRDRAGTLWVGTNRCLARAVGGRWECLKGTENRIVRSFVFPPQGGVFLGGAPSDLLYIAPDGTATSLGRELGQPADHNILALALGPGGDLWIATKTGLFRLAGAVPGPVVRVEIPGIPRDRRFASLLYRDGRLWTATYDGVLVLEAGAWRVLDERAGFKASSMRYFVASHDQRYCVAYSESLGASCFSYDGRGVSELEHFGAEEGLTSSMVYFLGEDRRQRLWIGTGNGVDVVTGRPGARSIEHFAKADGLAGDDAAANAFLEDTDGAVWLGSTGGATRFLAQRYIGPPAPPRARLIAGVLGDHELRSVVEDTPSVPHDRGALVIELGADSLIDASRVEFQVRLSPLESSWSTTSMRQARYPALPHGAYRLEMRARIGAGPWGPTAELRFTVRAAWWQSGWLFALAGAVVLAAIAALFTWRQRTVLRRRTSLLAAQSEARFRALIESMPDLVGVHRLSDNQLIYLNQSARRMHGLDATGELAGFQIAERIHRDDALRTVAMLDHAREVGDGDPEVVELRVRDGEGCWRTLELSAVRTQFAGAAAIVTSGRDITERNRLRAKLLVSDRMASLGTLAAGIAHEINNPLAYVIGNLEVISEQLGTGRVELTAALHDASDGAERVRKIVQSLRTFSRPEEEKRVPLDVAEVLEAAIRIAGNEVRHRAQLVRDLGPTPPAIADDGRLTQVFVNLLVNAAHAIPEGRSDANRITVRTRTDAQGHAVIEIEDTGHGMSPEVRARVFDPFFTTKDVGEGTGLGLSICHGIVSGLGGQISIDSAPERGTIVRVVLPVAASEPVVAVAEVVADVVVAAAVVDPAAPAAVRHRVLVVDDDPLVAEALRRVLRRDYDLTVASCGEAALAQIAAGAWFDAIVSDVMMPNTTGVELLEQLQSVAPEQAKRLIFLSGGVFTPQTRQRLDELGTPQLEKPVNSKQLRSCIARLILERQAA